MKIRKEIITKDTTKNVNNFGKYRHTNLSDIWEDGNESL